MEFKNFMYTEIDDDLTFLPKEPSLEFETGSPYVLINMEPPIVKTGLMGQEKKYRTRGGSSKPPVKRKLVQEASSLRSTRAKVVVLKDDSPFLTILDDDEGLPDVLELQNTNTCHLKISAITPPAMKNHLDNHLDVDFLDLHDQCYASQAVVDNAVNRRSRKLLKFIDQTRVECDAMKEKEKVRDKECEELKAKMFLESHKWAGYQVSLLTLESKVASLGTGKVKLEAIEASLRQELENARLDKAKLVSSAIFYGRCHAFEEVANMKEPFDITKVKGYRSSYKQDLTKDVNEFATATFPYLADVVIDPHASVKILFSKKPHILQHLVPTRTYVPASFVSS
nr:hypothetical protein [Tanacetum cinerariifolium]